MNFLKRGKKSKEAEKASAITNITDSFSTTSDDDLFSGMVFVPPAADTTKEPTSSITEPSNLEPQLDTMKELQTLDLTPQTQETHDERQDGPSKSAFIFINKEEVQKPTTADTTADTATADKFTADTSTGRTSGKQETGQPQTLQSEEFTSDSVSKRTAERAEGLKVGTTPVAASSSWKPVKAQTKVVKKKKRSKPIGALSKKGSSDVSENTSEGLEAATLSSLKVSEQTKSTEKSCTTEVAETLPSQQTLTATSHETKETKLENKIESDVLNTESDQTFHVDQITKEPEKDDPTATAAAQHGNSLCENKDKPSTKTATTEISDCTDGGVLKEPSDAIPVENEVDETVQVADSPLEVRKSLNDDNESINHETSLANEDCDDTEVEDNINVKDNGKGKIDEPAPLTSFDDVTDLNVMTGDQGLSSNSDTFSLELTESERLALDVEGLCMKENNIKNDRASLFTRRDQIIRDWQSAMLDVDTVAGKVAALREQQTMFEEEEDYDQAAEMNQQIQELLELNETFKYQHPVLDQKFIQLISEYQEQSTILCIEEEDILRAYQEVLTKQRDRIAEKHASRDKEFEEERLLLKEDKLKVERSLSHLALDKEHIDKSKSILDEEVEKKTKDLTQEKESLMESRSNVQEEIKELELKLMQLRAEETRFTTNIDDIISRIAMIFTEFQPRMEKLDEEKQRTETEEMTLNQQMEALKEKEDQVEAQKQKIAEEREKNESFIVELESRIERLQQNDSSKEDGETFTFESLLNVETILTKDDEQLSRLREEFKNLEGKFQSFSQQILSEEAQQSILKRSLNDLETQLSEFQKSKQVAVKERKYKDAKRLSEEIKALTEEGEVKQQQILSLEENLRTRKEEMDNDSALLEKAKCAYEKHLKGHDIKIIHALQEMSGTINSFLSRNQGSWFEEIFNLQLSTNETIISNLRKKHDLNQEDMSPTSKTNHQAQLKKELEALEKRLQEAADNEDWDLAEQINEEITTIKEALTGG